MSRLTYLSFNRLAAPSTQAWVTLATNDSYALGALVLASSLRRTNTARKIVVMVTPEGLRYHSYITYSHLSNEEGIFLLHEQVSYY